MGTHPMHNLKGLSHEDSMTLFEKWAFYQKEKQPRPDLLEMGNDIVEKCHGVPLLVKTMGSLLYTKDEVRYWAHIKDSEMWKLVEEKNDILPVLKLSYDHLPFHLQRCFATFALFPKGEEFDSSTLAWIWMASGLISSTTEAQALVDVGVEYIKEFWKRSLIQEVHEDFDQILFFKVHDLVYSLAKIVAQNDCSMVGLDNAKISEGVRYVSFSSTSLEGNSNFVGVPPFLRNPTSKKLRVLLNNHIDDDGYTLNKEFVRTCISKCKYLRILDLSSGSFEELPSSIRNLKQLRLLRLEGNKRLKKLPDTICELQNLLFLSLGGCSELGDLPKNMERLVSLTYLVITTKQKRLQESGIQHLENLHSLVLRECRNLQVLFESTCRLTRLRRLFIIDCERPIFVPFAELIALESLGICGCKLILTLENKPNFPSNLHWLIIEESKQVMELLHCLDDSTCSLEIFHVHNCPDFTTVPEWLPKHTHLKIIRFIKCPNLSFMPQGIRCLTSLKELCITDCGELSKRCQPTIGEDWAEIAHIPRIYLDGVCVQWEDD